MKLKSEVGDEKYGVEISRTGNSVRARIDDREYLLEVSEPESGVYLIKNGGKIYEAIVSGESTETAAKVNIRGSEFDIHLIDPKRLRGAGSVDSHSEGLAEIRTAMPGKVVRIILEVGAEVQKGDAVIVVEAMKMQNELKSPKAGILKEISVSEGATVAAGEILALID